MPRWAPWRNLWNLPLGCRTISSPRAPNWMETPCTSKPRPWSRQPFSDWNGSHVLQGPSSYCRWWTWVDGNAEEVFPLYLERERWFRDLIQCLAHSVIFQASTRQALIPTFVMVLFIVGERLAWWSSWHLPITSILFIIRGDIRTGRSSFSLCMA